MKIIWLGLRGRRSADSRGQVVCPIATMLEMRSAERPQAAERMQSETIGRGDFFARRSSAARKPTSAGCAVSERWQPAEEPPMAPAV